MRAEHRTSSIQHQTITSRQHPLCKLVRSLHSVKGRKKEKLFVVEGGNGVAAALAARWPLVRVLVASDELGESWRELAKQQNIETVTVSEELLEYLSDAQTSPDVIALAKLPAAKLPTAKLPTTSSTRFDGLTLVLDGIGDPGNVGTLIRTADAVGAGSVICTQNSADAWNPKVVRSSAGSVFHLPPTQMETDELITTLQTENVPIVAAVARDGISCFEYSWPEKCALILGHETRGISPELEMTASARVTIPMFGRAESLNVANAGAVLMYAWRRKNGS